MNPFSNLIPRPGKKLLLIGTHSPGGLGLAIAFFILLKLAEIKAMPEVFQEIGWIVFASTVVSLLLVLWGWWLTRLNAHCVSVPHWVTYYDFVYSDESFAESEVEACQDATV